MSEQWRFFMEDLRRWPAPGMREFLYNCLEVGIWSTFIYRVGRAFLLIPIPIVNIPFRIVSMFLFKFNEIVMGCAISPATRIGPGLFIGHTGCIRMHPDASAGKNFSIGPMTLIGAKGVGHRGVPQIGDDVFIGVGTIVIGPVKIGDGARIGAGAVVTTDIPAHATAGGVPAKVLRLREDSPASDEQGTS